MTSLLVDRIKPCPPFYNAFIDYFGPYVIKGEVQKRVRVKAYEVIITCATSRAVHIHLGNDYSINGFLCVLRRYTGIRGLPKKALSDKGIQLVVASNELIQGLGWGEITIMIKIWSQACFRMVFHSWQCSMVQWSCRGFGEVCEKVLIWCYW